MYLASILTSEIKDINQLRETIKYYGVQKELEDRVHGDYYSNISDIKYILKSVVLDIEQISGEIPEEVIFNVYKEICVRLELFEDENFGSNYRKGKTKELKSIVATDIEEFSRNYVKIIYEQYEKLCEGLKEEAKELYRFKCDVIDTFSNIYQNKVLVS